jgi:hypothetical protein
MDSELTSSNETLVRIAGDARIVYEMGKWRPWFAWRPVCLYMEPSRYSWLRRIWRRSVDKNGLESWDYTDSPDNFRNDVS